MGDKKRKKKNRRNIFYYFKQTVLGIFDAGMILAGVFVIVAALFYLDTPKIGDLSKREIAQTSVIYDRTGEHILYELFGEENRQILKHNEIPDIVRIATIAAEDDAFYSHIGIDFKSILRAAKVNAESDSIEQGASTITQQLARSIYLNNEKTLQRKIKEMILALKIERKYFKDEILDMYLNEVPYGSNAYGIEKAAQTFFGKSAKDLTLDEAALLAALPKATTHYSPYGKNKKELVRRQRNIIKRIGVLGLAGREDVKEALAQDTLAKVILLKRKIVAPHFVFYVLEKLEKNHKRSDLEKNGWKIFTSLDWEMQKEAEKIVREGIEADEKKYRATNGSVVAINPKTGEILAMVGSRNYFDDKIDGQVNVALQLRQPGSAFKPIVYARALEEGYQPETMLYDEQTNFGPDGGGRSYIPRNYDGKFHGAVSVRQALAMSLNIPAVKALRFAGVDDVLELAKRMGITTLTDTKNYGFSLALGGGAINLLEGTSAFSIFANDGVRNKPVSIRKITDSKGIVGYEFEPNMTRVIDAQIARKINSILSDNQARTPIFGPSSALYIAGTQVAAKTGTNQEYRDGWTIGYTSGLAAGVWVGNNDNSPMKYGAAGTFVAAPIWHNFMVKFINKFSVEKFADYDRKDLSKKLVFGEPQKPEIKDKKSKKNKKKK
ncbi:MAG: Penicillin-binding protein, 1A family [Candidatus Moranbacteria bacterium GW2011_GWE2_35_2-]|nr:MAG: Penicillin-binding protein, 1A family [Candidatus Moranbacteria bacterium GW2011_GWE2_35_2-]KKQ05817.1 MAG: Penicillin-binding protein, 1A family [Candidatus Moranbacteria bacterium GW2011_GWF1_36_4]KKQ22938.1 MAG: Penicillin-binding protein, 1A family [Candidatus Moranbacteria bacterium GW2011_GWF2_37_11]KKQ29296.1 MAG: Penicillin-binding protein, 1A family [Candidatus Moranbacteria bacterium GW2011_GWD1_37_17]KKQ30831.1 MAG: Penicillin-binding protein, 1A family [Candidatus Moranbacte